MATTRPLPRRVASPAFMTTPAHPPRPWPNLPAETQAQIAHVLAALLRRMPANSAIEESPRADGLERSCRAAERGPPRPARLHLRAPVLGQSGPDCSLAMLCEVGAHEQGRRGLGNLLPMRPHGRSLPESE